MLPRRTLSAIAAVLDVARLARGKPLPAKALAARNGLAPRQFEAVLQDLVRFGILKSLRGPRGGYELARERRRVSLGDVARAMQTAAVETDPGPDRTVCGDPMVEQALAEATAVYLAALDRVSIETLCRAADADREGAGDPDFHI